MKRCSAIILFVCIALIPFIGKAQDSSVTYTAPATDTALLRANGFTLSKDSVNALKNDPAFAYIKNLDSLLKITQREKELEAQRTTSSTPNWVIRLFASPITAYFLWIVAGLFVLLILYKLFFTKGFFQRPSTTISIKEIETEDELHANADYDQLITKAVNEKNFRLAVRYLYLQTLQKLTAKKLIEYSQDKTNYQYVHELKDPSFKNDFSSLTLQYEYVWYGKFELGEQTFSSIQNSFKNFTRQLSN